MPRPRISYCGKAAMSWPGFLAVYVLGGLTFIPLVLCLFFLHAYITLPARDADPGVGTGGKSDTNRPSLDSSSTVPDSAFESLPDELKTRAHVADVAAGYFAVCREYVPGEIGRAHV